MESINKKGHNIWTTLTLIILAIFALFIAYPLILVLYKSFIDPESGVLTLSYFTKFFSKRFYWSTLVNSFEVTICTTLLSVIIGLPMAYIMKKVKIKGSGLLSILIVISYLSPPFIGAYAWIQLLGRNGALTNIINSIFHVKMNGIYGFSGIVLVFTLQSYPLVYMYITGALKNLDNSLNEAAESLGCTGINRVIKIIMPLIMPTMFASSLLVFMRVFADFGTPMLIGEGFKTIPVLIYTQFMSEVGGDDGFAAALCVIVIIVTILLFFLQRFMANRNTYSMSALKPMEAKKEKGLKNIAHVFVYFVAFLSIIPQIVVIYTSFLNNNGGQVFTKGFSLKSYKATLLAKDNSVIRNTYLFGLAAIAIIVILGVLISYLTVRKKNFFTHLLDTLTMFPYIIPGSVLGISFLFGFNRKPLLLSGTAVIMIVAFSIRRMPYTIRSSTAIIGQISPSVEEAAISLGASEMKSFTKVTVPMMLPGVLAGAIMSWITVISELSSSIILYTTNTKTLTVSIYTEVIRGNYGNASAYSTILTLTAVTSLMLFFKISGKKEVSI
ncbi:ABC transporter permease subunit [Clostridium bovifaecis]|uniref:ABC transporter permease subunit n=1 Tax=Clostridium bovifaecis TaxID=2184719 RepID=A0A6I6ELK4_9CLOT|nr:ABC transporter permease subunit [Clostridium bovifaecis]